MPWWALALGQRTKQSRPRTCAGVCKYAVRRPLARVSMERAQGVGSRKVVSSLSLESALMIVRIKGPLTIPAPLTISSSLGRFTSGDKGLLHLLDIFEGLERCFVDGGRHWASATIYDEAVLFDLDRLVEGDLWSTFRLLFSRKGESGAADEAWKNCTAMTSGSLSMRFFPFPTLT